MGCRKLVVAAGFLWGLVGCSTDSLPPGPLLIAGQLTPADARGFTVAGSSLNCTTLSSPPLSAKATADSSGNVAMALKAFSVPFACNLTAANSSTTIPLIFSQGGFSGPLIVATSNLLLGSISVTTNGNGSVVAAANLPLSAQLRNSTPAKLSCLAGNWSVTPSQTCNGLPTNYQLFFTQGPDGSYQNAYLQNNGVVNTISLTGTTTTGSNCVAVSSTTGLSVGLGISDATLFLANSGGQGLIPDGTTIASLSACGAGQIQLSQSVTAGSGAVADSYLVTVCGTNARNTRNVNYSATNHTVSLTYQQPCYDIGINNLSGNAFAASGAGLVADLTPGSKCLTNLKFPISIFSGNPPVADADSSNTYFTAGVGTYVAAIPGTCGTGTFQMSVTANATGTALLSAYNLSSSTGYSTYSFYGAVTAGSPCVAPALPDNGALNGYFVAESAGAVSSSNGTGVRLVSPSVYCIGGGRLPYMLSETASAKAQGAESIVVIPPTLGRICTLGMCFDATGNGYSGAATCPSGTASFTAQTATDTFPINSSCNRLWASESLTCLNSADDDTSLGNHCGTGQNLSNTPPSAVRAKFAQTNSHCAACFPGASGGPDYPLNGCIGFGNVTCTAQSNGLGDASNIVVIKR